MLGVFDSGSGGLTVLRSLVKAFPQANFLYLGDHARAPYGDRSPEEITRFTKEALTWLFEQGCDEILFACNTASSIVLPQLRDDRVFGIVDPTRDWIARQKGGRIGLLATQATVDSGAYEDVTELQQACPAWAILIERGDGRSREAQEVVQQDVERLFATDSDIDTIVLACTHYPVFHDFVTQALPHSVPVVDQGQMVVDWMRRHDRMPLTGNGAVAFFTTGDPSAIASTSEYAFGASVRYTRATL